MKRIAFTLIVVLGGAGIAQADDGIYVGAGFGQSRLSPDPTRFDLNELNYDDTNQGFKLIAGIRPLDFVGAEVNYVNLGATHGFNDAPEASTPVRTDAKLYDAFAIGYVPIPFVDLFGKIGIARSQADYRVEGFQDLKLDNTDFAWGAGVQGKVGSLSARMEFEKFNLPATREASLLSVGLTWTFL